MNKNLYHFYQLTKSSIRILFVSGASYYFIIALNYIGSQFLNLEGIYTDYNNVDHGHKWEFYLNFILIIIDAIFCTIYFYLSTKTIDFVLYIRAWMYGHGILDKFENMSYLISHSCFYRKDISSSLDASESIISQELDLKLKESIENDEMTGDYKISAQTFTSYSES